MSARLLYIFCLQLLRHSANDSSCSWSADDSLRGSYRTPVLGQRTIVCEAHTAHLFHRRRTTQEISRQLHLLDQRTMTCRALIPQFHDRCTTISQTRHRLHSSSQRTTACETPISFFWLRWINSILRFYDMSFESLRCCYDSLASVCWIDL